MFNIQQTKPQKWSRHCFLWLTVLLTATSSWAGIKPSGHPNFLSPHSNPIVLHNNKLFVANTANDTVDVIDTNNRQLVKQINVGIDPVGLAIRPDGSQVWVSNHVSDSISIIDNNPESPSYLVVVATLQDFDPNTKATRFDEPVGLAFASNDKAYVALSSENQVAVVDTHTYQITKRLNITAQDPRALYVKNNRLYVIPFESNNQTQISGCVGAISGGLCTFDATEHVVTNNNVLSQNIVVDVIKHPAVPDRDLFIYDTNNDQLITTVSAVGTLLYGIAVNSQGQVYVTQTDARNDANGATGTLGDGLQQMGNRAFLNQVTTINCAETSCQAPQFIDLEPLPPENPASGQALATPFAIQISNDEKILVITAASSNQLVMLDASNQQIISRIEVGKVPRGIALEHNSDNQLTTAWVLNAVANSVSQVDISSPQNPLLINTILLEDPTHPDVKKGRMAFNDAKASTTETFACESCHPDGGTDQLLWVLDTPVCNLPGCDQIPPRITMPIRGLRDTAPYHWDGIPGDPYGGINTASINAITPANCSLDDPQSCTRNLVDGGLASTMCTVGDCPTNDEHKAGALDAEDRDAMAKFLLSVPYPPALRRAYDNVLSTTAKTGFNLFHIQGDNQGNPTPNVCGDCHRMPFWVSTNTAGTGMEAPTWRGAYDRWLILPQGRLNIIDFNFFEPLTRLGIPEERMWRLSWANRARFNPVWNMVTEGSTGFSGAFARQIPLNSNAVTDNLTIDLFQALEGAAQEGGVLLQGSGVWIEPTQSTPVEIEYFADKYWLSDHDTPHSRSELITMVTQGQLIGTLTARLGQHVDVDHPQPALWTLGSMHLQRGQQRFPTIESGSTRLFLSGRHVSPAAHIVIDGKRFPGIISCAASGRLPNCQNETIEIKLAYLPENSGQHFLQVQNPDGLFSNDFIFNTLQNGQGMPNLDLSGPWFNSEQNGHGWYLELLEPLNPDEPQRLLAYWYTYRNGEPVWLLGLAPLSNGRAQMNLSITSGTQFPPEFDSNEVTYNNWGFLEFEFSDAETGKAFWHSDISGFAAGEMTINKIAAISDHVTGCLSGSYTKPDQPGHGINIQVVDSNNQDLVLITWYTYQNGQQLWLTGSSQLTGQQAQVQLNQFSGPGFPPEFDTNELNSNPWGTIQLDFSNPNQLDIEWTSDVEGFGTGSMTMVKLTQLSGHVCD